MNIPRHFGRFALPDLRKPERHTAALAFGALALGAFAVGALAIGALAIGRLTIKRARINRLEIGELVVRSQSPKNPDDTDR